MNKKLIANFIKDNIGFASFYFVNTFLIALFYRISTQNKIEYFYPALIAIFIFIVFIVFKWASYYKFNIRLIKGINTINYDLEPSTNEQKEISRLISETHQTYMDKINEIQIRNTTNKKFISQWIHNMKTPISVIDLILQQYQSGQIKYEEALDSIKHENAGLLTSLDQVLGLLRLEDFPRDYIPETVDLVASLKKVINHKKNQFIYNKVFPKINTSQESILIFTDSKWNEMIIEQIVSNAIKYSANGIDSKTVYFNIEKVNKEVILTIKDEGIGIPDYDIRRVFEPFFTGENGRKYRNSSGIGLYISMSIAQKLGHKLLIKSKVGEGTELSVAYLSKL